MESTTIQKYIHTSPRKLRLVADMVRSMNPDMAMSVLQITPKSAAKDLFKAISTVLASAKMQGLNMQNVNFKKIEINESTKMRRFKAGTRGRVKPFKRRMSHIKIVVSDELGVRSAKMNERVEKNNASKQKESVMDDSAKKTKSGKGGRTESSK